MRCPLIMGSAASAGAFILAAGTKGKRMALKNSRIMLHQVSSEAGGNVQDMEIVMEETRTLNTAMLREIASLTGNKLSKIEKETKRDKYMSAEEAIAFGVIDKVLVNRGSK